MKNNLYILLFIVCMHSTAYGMDDFDISPEEEAAILRNIANNHALRVATPKKNNQNVTNAPHVVQEKKQPIVQSFLTEEFWRNLEEKQRIAAQQNNQNTAIAPQSVQQEKQRITDEEAARLRNQEEKQLIVQPFLTAEQEEELWRSVPINALHVVQEKKQPEIPEPNNQLALPDWRGVHSQLVNDYKNILKTKLEEYKTADIATWNAKELTRTLGDTITKLHIYKLLPIIVSIVDEHANTFLHYAVEKDDERMVSELLFFGKNNKNPLAKNSNGETPFDLCIKKLLPNIPAKKTETPKKIFNELASDISIWCKDDSAKIDCLKKVIDLQLKHAWHGSEFSVRPQKLVDFITLSRWKDSEEQKKADKELLATYYRQAQDEDGDTFTHALVDDPDKLFELVKRGHASFAKNKHGRTALDVAKRHLFYHVQPACRERDPEGPQRTSCCMYILLNHAKALAQKEVHDIPDVSDISDFGPCCEKHTLPKDL